MLSKIDNLQPSYPGNQLQATMIFSVTVKCHAPLQLILKYPCLGLLLVMLRIGLRRVPANPGVTALH